MVVSAADHPSPRETGPAGSLPAIRLAPHHNRPRRAVPPVPRTASPPRETVGKIATLAKKFCRIAWYRQECRVQWQIAMACPFYGRVVVVSWRRVVLHPASAFSFHDLEHRLSSVFFRFLRTEPQFLCHVRPTDYRPAAPAFVATVPPIQWHTYLTLIPSESIGCVLVPPPRDSALRRLSRPRNSCRDFLGITPARREELLVMATCGRLLLVAGDIQPSGSAIRPHTDPLEGSTCR